MLVDEDLLHDLSDEVALVGERGGGMAPHGFDITKKLNCAIQVDELHRCAWGDGVQLALDRAVLVPIFLGAEVPPCVELFEPASRSAQSFGFSVRDWGGFGGCL